MAIPLPPGDTEQPWQPLGAPVRAPAPPPTKPIPGKPGFSRDKDGRLQYDGFNRKPQQSELFEKD